MQVISWEPLVVFRESRPGKFEHYCVIQAHLRCVFCHSVFTIEAHPVIIREDKKPYEYIHSGMAVMKQHRKCECCGVISGLPTENEKRLQKAAEKIISAEWIAEKSQLDPPLVFIQQAEREIAKLLGED